MVHAWYMHGTWHGEGARLKEGGLQQVAFLEHATVAVVSVLGEGGGDGGEGQQEHVEHDEQREV